MKQRCRGHRPRAIAPTASQHLSSLPSDAEPAASNSTFETTHYKIPVPPVGAPIPKPPYSSAAHHAPLTRTSHRQASQIFRNAADSSPVPLRLPKRLSRPAGDIRNHDSDARHERRWTHPPPARRSIAGTRAASCPIRAAQSQTPAPAQRTARAKTQNSRSTAEAAGDWLPAPPVIVADVDVGAFIVVVMPVEGGVHAAGHMRRRHDRAP